MVKINFFLQGLWIIQSRKTRRSQLLLLSFRNGRSFLITFLLQWFWHENIIIWGVWFRSICILFILLFCFRFSCLLNFLIIILFWSFFVLSFLSWFNCFFWFWKLRFCDGCLIWVWIINWHFDFFRLNRLWLAFLCSPSSCFNRFWSFRWIN